MKAIIIGAGMGGLSAGIALKNIGWDVEVYEKVREIRPVGAAISIWSNGVKCLNYLGLHEQVKALGGQMDDMAYRDGLTGEEMTQFSLEPLYRRAGQRAYPVSRPDLQAMLMDEFGKQDVTLGMRLVSVEDDGEKVTAHFEDGSTATGDMLIGADGAHSVVRPYILGHSCERRYSGYVNYNGLVEIDESIAPAHQWTTFVGEGQRVSMMPIAGNRFYFFFDAKIEAGLEADRSQTKADLRRYFKGWAEPVQRLIDKIDESRTNRVEVFDVEPFHTWVKGRVALLGDAAHNTTPDIGQGGCSAFEDSVVLSIMLKVNTLGVEDALKRYEAKRAIRAGELVSRARKRCDVTHAKDPAATEAWYKELRSETGEHIMNGIYHSIEGNPLD